MPYKFNVAKPRLEQLRKAKKHLLNAESALEAASWTSKLQESVHDVIRIVQYDIDLEEKKQASKVQS